jgi:hypothetical protein
LARGIYRTAHATQHGVHGDLHARNHASSGPHHGKCPSQYSSLSERLDMGDLPLAFFQRHCHGYFVLFNKEISIMTIDDLGWTITLLTSLFINIGIMIYFAYTKLDEAEAFLYDVNFIS